MSPQAEWMQKPEKMPLVFPPENRSEYNNKDAKMVNCFAEQQPLSGEYQVEKRAGLGLAAQYSGIGYGVWNWLGDVYSIYGGFLLKNGVSLGAVDTSNGVYKFEPIRSTPPVLVFGNGTFTYYTDGTTITPITGNADVFAGYFVVGSKYTITVPGTTDFTLIGAANNLVGTSFIATGNGVGTGMAQLNAGYLVVGNTYAIATVGSTDFTLVGAANNTIGTVFTATGVGTGTGTVQEHNFPSVVVKGFAYLDGTLYVMKPNAEIRGSSSLPSLDQVVYWDPLNSITARIEPDSAVCLAKHLVYVIALKQWTSEAFYDAGNPNGSPLAPVQGAKSPYGCVNADSVQSIDDNLLWLASNQKVSPQVVMMTDLKVHVVSTPPIERLLDQADRSVIRSWTFKHAGHRFYGLTLVNSNMTLVFDMDQGLWSYWTDTNGNYWPITSFTYDSTNQHICQHESNGALYYAENCYEYPTDNGALISVDIITPNADMGIDRRKHLTMMRFNCDKIVNSLLYVRHSDDDYLSWTNFRSVNTGNTRPILVNCGTFYKRAWHLHHAAATPLRIRCIYLQFDVGSL